MNYRKLHRAILDKYWDNDSDRVTALLRKIAKKRYRQIHGEHQPRDSFGDMMLKLYE